MSSTASGGVLMTIALSLPGADWLPARSVWVATTVSEPPSGGAFSVKVMVPLS